MTQPHSFHENFGRNPRNAPGSSRERLLQIATDPMLRWQDVHGGQHLLQLSQLYRNDPHLTDLLAHTIDAQVAAATAANDPFYGNYPTCGSLPDLVPRRIPLASLPTGDVLSLSIDRLSNMLIVGPTRWGKSNLLRLLIYSLVRAGAIVVAFDPKADLAECSLLWERGLPTVVMDWEEIKLAFFQPPPGVSVQRWINVKDEQVLGLHLGLHASRRLGIETMHAALAAKRSKGIWPPFDLWVETVARVNPRIAGRISQYKEALLYALKQIQLSGLGSVLNHVASNFLLRIFNGDPRAYVIRTGGLSSTMASVLVSEFVAYLYELRGVKRLQNPRPVVFVMDDAVSLLKGGLSSEAHGEDINPLSQWSLLGNGRGIYFIGATQLFRWTSGAFVHNCHTIASVGSSGDDAWALAKHLDLTPDQAAMLGRLEPGELIIRAKTEYPLAVYGRHPLAE